jgi:dCTP deaminase
MTLMTDREIQKTISSGELDIENFSERFLQPASYDMRLGGEAFTSTGREMINTKEKGILLIEAGDFAVVTTYEKLKLSRKTAGHIGLRSHYVRKGLVLLTGPQIDPGFEGILVIGVCNLSPRDIIIPYKESFCTVEFYELNEEVERPYSGQYQLQERISAKDIEFLTEAKGMSFAEVIKTLSALSVSMEDLSKSVNMLKWSITTVVVLGITIIGIIATIT